MNGIGSGLCPVVDFGISNVECFGFSTGELQVFSQFIPCLTTRKIHGPGKVCFVAYCSAGPDWAPSPDPPSWI